MSSTCLGKEWLKFAVLVRVLKPIIMEKTITVFALNDEQASYLAMRRVDGDTKMVVSVKEVCHARA